MLIFSYEAVKYQKVSVYIMKGLSFDYPKNTTAFTSDSQSSIFFFFFLTPKIGLERDPSNPVTALDSSKQCQKIISPGFLSRILDSSASKAFQVQFLRPLAKHFSQKLKSANIGQPPFLHRGSQFLVQGPNSK